MSSLFGRIRSGAGKAAFEADKLRRITSVQSSIRSLRSDAEKAYYQIGHVAFALYRDNQIAQPGLRQACERLAAIQAQIATHEHEIEEIRAEEYVEPVSGPQFGRVCPNGHGPIPLPNNFCQECGARAVEIPPPTQAIAGLPCRYCGTTLSPGVRFCSNCGQAVVDTSPIPAPTPHVSTCPNCGSGLMPDAEFCAECGYKVNTVETTAVKSTAVEPATEEEISALAALEAAVCPACQAPLMPDALFCAECGHALAPAEEDVTEVTDEAAAVFSHGMLSSSEVADDAAEEDKFPTVISVQQELGRLDIEGDDASLEESDSDANRTESTIQNEAEEEVMLGTLLESPEAALVEKDQEPYAVPIFYRAETCPVCDASLLPDAIFCAECGHRITEA